MKPKPKSKDAMRGAEKRPVLFDARNVAVAEVMIRRGADLRQIGENKSTALHTALEAGRLDVARYLIERGADINHCDDYDTSVLDSAVAEGDLEFIRLLVTRGVDLHRVGKEGKGALHVAAYQGRLEVVKLLIDLGVDVNECRHPSRNASEEAELQRELGVAVATLPLTIPLAVLQFVEDREMWSSLRESNLLEECEGLCELLIAGLEEMESSRAVPPLVYALAADRMETARYLISRGARYNFGNTGLGAEVFLEAVEAATPEAVRFMFDHGAAVHCKREIGARLLITAVRKRRDVEVIRMLLDAGAPLGGTLDDGESSRDNDPLSTGDGLVLGWAGIEVDVIQADTRGWTPLHFATRLGYEEAAQLLMERGADVHARSTVGETPLDLAVPFEQPRPGVNDEFPDEYETGRVVRNKTRTAIGELLKTVQAKTPAASVRR